MFRLSASSIARSSARIQAGKSQVDGAIDMLMTMPVKQTSLKTPGVIKASLKMAAEEGMFLGDVLEGVFSNDSILNAAAKLVSLGEFTVSVSKCEQKRIGVAGKGSAEYGTVAAELFVEGAYGSDSTSAKDWAERVYTADAPIAVASDAVATPKKARKPRSKKTEVTVNELVGKQ